MIIDRNGNLLKPESSIDPFEYFIIKLKKIFEELPPGLTKAKLDNYLSAFDLFTESAEEYGIQTHEMRGLIEACLTMRGYGDINYISLTEDMGAGGMATAGTSSVYNTGGVSGFDPVMGSTSRKGLDNCGMFDVCPEEFKQFKSAKAWKHLPNSDTTRYIRRYQRRNPKGHIALRSVDPDTGKSNFLWVRSNYVN